MYFFNIFLRCSKILLPQYFYASFQHLAASISFCVIPIFLYNPNTLEANNLVTAYEDDASGKTRKYYHITREGRRILKEKKEEWKVYAKAVTDVLTMEG